MNKYKTKEVITGKENTFSSMAKISEHYPEITKSNLAYHFTRCKKTSVIIRGVYINRL